MNTGTKIQMAIHRHYDNIKLVLQLVIIGLIVVVMINANVLTDRITSTNQESAAEIAGRIDRETQLQSEEIKRQTDQLNQQFQALCFIIVQIAGEDALRQIDPPLEEQCKALVQELREETETQQTAPQLPARPQSIAPIPVQPQQVPVERRSGNQVQPDPPMTMPRDDPPAEPSNDSWLLGGLNSLLNGIGL